MGNPVVHFEVAGKDGPALQKFYGDLFDWKIDNSNPMGYGLVDTDSGGLLAPIDIDTNRLDCETCVLNICDLVIVVATSTIA